jgi:hypothetical protein
MHSLVRDGLAQLALLALAGFFGTIALAVSIEYGANGFMARFRDRNRNVS